ncbi:MAG: PAS domain-containing protein [Deltaproteobacteria bacterium]|nr:PAS domain-containing protein [Deltaproteobacteria bacterium]
MPAKEMQQHADHDRYQRFINALSDYVFTVRIEQERPVGTIHSSSCAAVTGYGLEDFTRDPYLWIKMVHPDDRAAVQQQTEVILQGTEVKPLEHRIVCRDGTVRWVRNTTVLHFNTAHDLYSYDGIIQDITDQRLAEYDLQHVRGELTRTHVVHAAAIHKMTAQLNDEVALREQVDAELERRTHHLHERIKEMNCLYGISRVLEQQDLSIGQTLREVVKLIPSALKYAEITCACISVGEQHYAIGNYRKTAWKLESSIVVQARVYGTLEVCYLEERPDLDEGPFLQEERLLADLIASQLGRMVARKQALDDLAASEHKYRTVFENLPQRVFYKNLDSVYVLCNRNYAGDLRVAPDAVIGKTDYDLYSHDVAEQYRAEDERVYARDTLEDSEERFVCDGKEITVQKVKTPVQDEDGTVIGILGAYWDITERKRIEADMVRVEAALQEKVGELSIKNEISEVLLSTRELDEILYIILIGATASQALGFNRAFLFLASSDGAWLEGTVATGPLSDHEAHATWKRLAREQPTLVELLRSYDEDQSADKPINDMVRGIKIALTSEPNIFSQAFSEQRSFNVQQGSQNALIDQELIRRLGTDYFAVVPLVARGRSLGLVVADNYITKKPIGDRHVSLLGEFAKHASMAIENAHLYQSVQEKLEELSTAYADLQLSRDKLVRVERLSAVGTVAAQVAHDIRNPLTAIGGFARRILKKGYDAREHEKHLNIIVQEIDRLEKILSDLLSFVSPGVPSLDHADLNLLISGICETFEVELETKQIRCEQRLDTNLPTMWLDDTQIRRVIINLVQNAIDSMLEGGSLTLETRREDKWVFVEIADTGSGIAEDMLNKLFEPFYTNKATGSGLGLTLCDQIVKKHGGTIVVLRRQQQGILAIIKLPLHNPL